MSDWINSIINSDHTGIIVFSAVFLLGIIGVFSCACNFAVIGAVTGYTGALGATGKTKTIVISSIFVFTGAVTAMSAVGFVIGFAGEIISAAIGNYWKIVAGIILLFLGIYILDIFPFKIPKILPDIKRQKSGMAGAVLFGLLIGGITVLGNICCNPIFPIVAAASFVKGSMLWGFLMLFFYASGYSITIAAAILGVGLGIGKISKIISKLAVIIKYAGGITLIVLGFYFLITI